MSTDVCLSSATCLTWQDAVVPFMPVEEMMEFENTIVQAVQGAREWVATPVMDRDPTLLAHHFGTVELVMQHLVGQRSALPSTEYHRMFLPLNHLHDTLDNIQQQEPLQLAEPYKAPLAPPTGKPGRRAAVHNIPAYAELLWTTMTYKEIASVMGVSVSSVRRMAAGLGRQKRKYTMISKEELAVRVREAYARGSGQQGYRTIQVSLLNQGIKVKRRDVQQACREADPLGVRQRFAKTRVRRRYQVPCINSVWHVDGHHKLNPYGFVIHGGIDGYSRRIVFMGVSNNNRADTVTKLFDEAVQNNGWPSRVRVDYGKENLGIKERMERVMGVTNRRGTCSAGGLNILLGLLHAT